MYTIFLLLTFLILVLAFYEWQYYMVFSPTYYREELLDEAYCALEIQTEDGVFLEGVLYTPKEFDATLLFFGGRSHDSVGLIKKLSLALPHARIITFNYRSYGKSGGSVNEKNMFSDGLEIARLMQKNYGDFYILGFSLGASVASYVAGKVAVLGLFLVGPFDSLALLGKERLGVDLSFFYRYKFDNINLVKNLDVKTYVFVSKSDETTYIKNARNLKNHVKNLCLYKELENITHKELLWNEEVLYEIKKVLK